MLVEFSGVFCEKMCFNLNSIVFGVRNVVITLDLVEIII